MVGAIVLKKVCQPKIIEIISPKPYTILEADPIRSSIRFSGGEKWRIDLKGVASRLIQKPDSEVGTGACNKRVAGGDSTGSGITAGSGTSGGGGYRGTTDSSISGGG